MQRSHAFAPSQLGIALARKREQTLSLLQCDNGVYLRIELADVIQVGVHYLGA
jgi:hypothetical protein